MSIEPRIRYAILCTLAALLMALTSACAGGLKPTPFITSDGVNTPPAAGPQVEPSEQEVLQPANTTEVPDPQASTAEPAGDLPEVVVYASDLPENALTDELAFWDDPASPGGKMIGIPNNGDELDPPPENDPHLTFMVPVQSGIPYRCWIHMKVGMPKGKSEANVMWVQFSDSVDQEKREVFKPETGSYLTAHGPSQPGWSWVACQLEDSETGESLIYFRKNGEITVRMQAGMEGVGFDQFELSPAQFLGSPPTEMIVNK
jgi:hypothetical protein